MNTPSKQPDKASRKDRTRGPLSSSGGHGLIYGSVCSGIEAATEAWHQLGWKAAWYSEIEKFPSAVLAHRYPKTPNLGDMTRLNDNPKRTAINLLVGGTPCQSFSVAGLRKGMADARGNLALVFILLLRRTGAEWVLWENVPGVLSSNGGRDLGSFFGGLVGREISVPEEGWGGAGIIEPTTKDDYGIAWRVLDAQYFGVPQRRRRIFVVGYIGDWRPAAAVLLELNCVQGHPAPSREAGEGTAAGTIPSTEGGELGGQGLIAKTLTAKAGYRANASDETLITHSLTKRYDSSEDGSGRGLPLVAVTDPEQRTGVITSPDNVTLDGDDAGPSGPGFDASGTMFTLTKTDIHAVAQVYDMRGRGDGTIAQTLCTNHASRPSDMCPIAFTHEETPKWSKDCEQSLDAQNGRRMSVATSFMWQSALGVSATEEGIGTLIKNQTPAGQRGSAVRRLTPVECERLQGFPDGHTDVPYRGKPASDGPRYKALGNSMAVPVMRWIGERIQAVEDSIKGDKC